MKAWGEDYNLMRARIIYEEDPPSYEELITEMIALRKRINKLEWTIEMPYLKEEPQEL